MKIEELLEKVAEREGVLEPFIEIPGKSGDGQGFLADVGAVTIKGKSKRGEQVVLKLIIKSAATNEKLREKSAVAKIFAREIFMYKSVFPAYYSFEKERGISNPFCSAAKFYGASMANTPELLILENLTENGYRIWNRWQQMNDNHVRMVMREYGRFHAISFAIQDQKPELFRELTDKIDNVLEVFLRKSGFFHTFVDKTKQAQASLDPHTDKHILERYSSFLNEVEDTFQELVRCDDKHYAILHGDCWSNNMLFSYENPNNLDQPASLRLIDFQMARLGSPMRDLVYFIYPCATKEVLENLDMYKGVYYDSFSNHLKRLGTDPEKVYPLATFEKDFRKYVRFGLVISSLTRYAMLSEDNEVMSFANIIQSGKKLNTAFDYEIANMSKYQERMREVIIHCVQNNFL